MTLIIAHHLIEGPVLISDSRATNRQTKKPSDTATKIIPLTNDMIVGIVGNPHQAASILIALKNEYIINHSILDSDSFIKNIKYISDKVQPVDKNNSKCTLIFAYLNRNKNQKVPVDKLRFYLNKTGKPITGGGGSEVLSLMAFLMSDSKEPTHIEFSFPESYMVTLDYPFPQTKEVLLLEAGAWGSGAKLIKDELDKESYKLWSLEAYKDVPWFKTMILSVSTNDTIKKGNTEYFIGGLPQVVALTPKGIFFQSYSSGGPDKEEYFSMIYNNGSWEQINHKTGKIVKTFPGILNKRTFSESEIVDFSLTG